MMDKYLKMWAIGTVLSAVVAPRGDLLRVSDTRDACAKGRKGVTSFSPTNIGT
jgi:hypothetical protein